MSGTKEFQHKKRILVPTFFLCLTITCTVEAYSELCGQGHFTNAQGRITSPNYPSPYPNYTSCTWMIIAPSRHALVLRLLDLDIEEDINCKHPPCCVNNWVSIPRPGGRAKQKICGNLTRAVSVIVLQPQTLIKFHSSAVHKGGRGFLLTYKVYEGHSYEDCKHCPDGRCVQDMSVCSMFSCLGAVETPCRGDSYDCFNETQRCNGIQDCQSGKDEEKCPRRSNCLSDEFRCLSGSGCYKFDQKCDLKPDCADNTDEANCDDVCVGKHKCNDGRGCYSSVERCDGVQNCEDNSDEEYCYRRFQCDDGNYIPHSQWCDGLENCRDGSDEEGCIKNSVIAAAIMGSLLCSLLLVIAVGCMCRLYSLRLAVTNSYRIHHNGENFVAQPPVQHLDEEFFNREPPPAYSVAVSGCSLQCAAAPPNSRLFAAEHNAMQRHQHSGSRRSSRRHTSRRRSQRNIIVGVAPQCDSNIAVNMQPQTLTSNYSGLATSQLPVLSLSPSSVPGANDTILSQQGEAILIPDNTNNKINGTDCNVSPSTVILSNQGGESISQDLYDSCILNVSVIQPHTRGTVSPSHSCVTSASESPSRNSVTSSTSLLSYLSGDDDEQLLVVPAS